MPHPLERSMGGRTWAKRRAGCYVHPLAGTRLRLVLLRLADGTWTASATHLCSHGRGRTILWKSAPVEDATVAAEVASAWVVVYRLPVS